jgi:TetR/AcrR family transcriptional regulator, cholesterol catabolism regulator
MDSDIRRSIQKTAARLFLKYGLRSVSIDDICNELRISKKTFYQFFSQKEELIESVLLEHDEKKFDKKIDRSRKCMVNGNMIDKILAYTSFHLVNSNNQFVNFFFDLNKYYPEIHKKQILRNHDKFCEQIKEGIIKGIDEGIFRNDVDIDMMAQFLSFQFMTVMNLVNNDRTKGKFQNVMVFLTDIHIRLLCNRKGLDYYESVKGKSNYETERKNSGPIDDKEIDMMIDKYLNSSDELIKATMKK